MESSAHLKGRKRTERNNHQVCATFQPLVRGNISCPMPSVRTGTTSSAACAAEPLKADQARSAANTGRTARFLRIAGLMFGPLAYYAGLFALLKVHKSPAGAAFCPSAGAAFRHQSSHSQLHVGNKRTKECHGLVL